MPVESIRDVVEDVEAIGERLTSVLELAETPGMTHETAQSIVASLEGIKADARTTITDLDSTQDEDLLIVEDGAILLRLWNWHRDVRRYLLGVIGKADDAQDVADEYVGGQDQKVVFSKQGDTLQRIAARELGSWNEWPRLLQANPGVSVGNLPPGTPLIIPEKR